MFNRRDIRRQMNWGLLKLWNIVEPQPPCLREPLVEVRTVRTDCVTRGFVFSGVFATGLYEARSQRSFCLETTTLIVEIARLARRRYNPMRTQFSSSLCVGYHIKFIHSRHGLLLCRTSCKHCGPSRVDNRSPLRVFATRWRHRCQRCQFADFRIRRRRLDHSSQGNSEALHQLKSRKHPLCIRP